VNYLPHIRSLAPTPNLAVLGFRRQLVYHLHLWAFIAVAPLVVVQWQQGHQLLAWLLLLFCVNALLVIAFLKFRQIYFLNGRLFPLLAVVSATYSTAINGHAGLYWAYPAATALFFLVPLREAIICNIVFVLVMAAVSFVTFAESHFWRIVCSLSLTCMFAMIFAWLVGKLQQELTRLATTDPLTGCLNRSQLSDILNNYIQLRERYERVSSLILIDLDYFKTVNDQWGHLAGDQVLTEMAKRLRNRLRENDQLFRIGGEEFMIVLPETRQRDAHQLAQQLLACIRARPFLDSISLTASAGVAEVGKGETWSTWLNRADQALYDAKARSRNQVADAPKAGTGPATPIGTPVPGLTGSEGRS